MWGLISEIRDTGVTILLVTHFMEEAERLCDRVAVIDNGRVIATDTPGGLASRAGGEQSIRFRASAPLDEKLLRELPLELGDVHHRHRHVRAEPVHGDDEQGEEDLVAQVRDPERVEEGLQHGR